MLSSIFFIYLFLQAISLSLSFIKVISSQNIYFIFRQLLATYKP